MENIQAVALKSAEIAARKPATTIVNKLRPTREMERRYDAEKEGVGETEGPDLTLSLAPLPSALLAPAEWGRGGTNSIPL